MEEPYPYATFEPRDLKSLFEAREALEDGHNAAAYELLDAALNNWEKDFETREEQR